MSLPSGRAVNKPGGLAAGSGCELVSTKFPCSNASRAFAGAVLAAIASAFAYGGRVRTGLRTE